MNFTLRSKTDQSGEMKVLIKKLFLGFHVLLWIGLTVYLILLLIMKIL